MEFRRLEDLSGESAGGLVVAARIAQRAQRRERRCGDGGRLNRAVACTDTAALFDTVSCVRLAGAAEALARNDHGGEQECHRHSEET